MGHVEKLNLRLFQNKTETFLVSVRHLILRFTIVQNKFQQTNETKTNHNNGNHIKFGYLYIFWRSGLLCSSGTFSNPVDYQELIFEFNWVVCCHQLFRIQHCTVIFVNYYPEITKIYFVLFFSKSYQ